MGRRASLWIGILSWGGLAWAAPLRASDCGYGEQIPLSALPGCLQQFTGNESACPACDLGGDGGVDILELQSVVQCFVESKNQSCGRASLYDGVCGNSEVEGTETCDDGNNHGGDGCAANCTLETDLTLNLGDPEHTQSRAVLQATQFAFDLPLTGSQVFTLGHPRPLPVRGADGFTNFEAGALPFAGVVEKNRDRIEPVVVPGLVCACVHNISLQACGGRPVVPGDTSKICTLDVFENIDPSVCPANDGCKPVFGPGVSLAGSMGCKGARNLDYVSTAESGTGATTFERRGGRAAFGGTALTLVSLGLIFDSGTCSIDPTDPKKGADGVPCTDDDSIDAQGSPEVALLTTGKAAGAILNANNEMGKNIDANRSCGMQPCVTAATGKARSCADLLAGKPEGICMAGVFSRLAPPATGDVVVSFRYCAVP